MVPLFISFTQSIRPGRRLGWLCVLMWIFFWLWGHVHFSFAADMSVLPNRFMGAVLWPDGQSPVTDLQIRVWDADRDRVVYRTRTNNDGMFNLPDLGEGNLYVTAGPVRIDLRILEAQGGILTQPHGIVIILPRRVAFGPVMTPGGVSMLIPPVLPPGRRIPPGPEPEPISP